MLALHFLERNRISDADFHLLLVRIVAKRVRVTEAIGKGDDILCSQPGFAFAKVILPTAVRIEKYAPLDFRMRFSFFFMDFFDMAQACYESDCSLVAAAFTILATTSKVRGEEVDFVPDTFLELFFTPVGRTIAAKELGKSSPLVV
jgi:hypothetical protein